MHEAAHEIMLRTHLGDSSAHLFDYLKLLHDQHVEVTDTTWEVKNLIASLAATDPSVLRGRPLLARAVIERCETIMEFINLELAHDTAL